MFLIYFCTEINIFLSYLIYKLYMIARVRTFLKQNTNVFKYT